MVNLSWLLTTLLGPVRALLRLVQERLHLINSIEKFPGPFALPVLGNTLNIAFLDTPGMLKYMLDTTKQYRRFVRFYVGPMPVVISKDPLDLEVILGSQKYIRKADLYKFLQPWLGDGLLMSTGEKWRCRRKLLTPAFHFEILKQFLPVFSSCGDEFVRQLRSRAGGGAFDLQPVVKLLTLDVVCETVMGVRMNAQTNSDSEYVRAVHDISDVIVHRMFRPWLYIDFLYNMSKSGRRFHECLQILHSTTLRVIRERKMEFEKIVEKHGILDVDELGRRRRVAFLDLLLLAARDGSLSDTDVREEVDTFMFEGHDTTASAISFTLFLLARHQHEQDKLLEELHAVFDAPKPLDPSLEQLSELKYLEMVIKESLRMYAPVAGFARSINEVQELSNTDLKLPSGCTFMVELLINHHNPALFPEPAKFDPQRFNADECARRHPYAYLPFSAGPRNCIGQRFAMLEMKSVIAKIVWNFRLLPVSDFEPIVTWELIVKSANGLLIQIEERKSTM